MEQETEYRARAAYCVRVSETAKNSAHRAALLQQAQTLLRMADQSERLKQIVDPEDRMASYQFAASSTRNLSPARE